MERVAGSVVCRAFRDFASSFLLVNALCVRLSTSWHVSADFEGVDAANSGAPNTEKRDEAEPAEVKEEVILCSHRSFARPVLAMEAPRSWSRLC